MIGRIRTVKPELFLDEDLWTLCSAHADLPLLQAFIGLWCVADREGRFEWKPGQLRVSVLPYWGGDMSLVLSALSDGGFISAYEISGIRYGWIPTFKKHQRPNPKEAQSCLPAPPDAPPAPSDTPDCHASQSGLERVEMGNVSPVPFPSLSSSQTQTRATPQGPAAGTRPSPARHQQPLRDAVAAEYFKHNLPAQSASPNQWLEACKRVQDALDQRHFASASDACAALAKAAVAEATRKGGTKLAFAIGEVGFVSSRPAGPVRGHDAPEDV